MSSHWTRNTRNGSVIEHYNVVKRNALWINPLQVPLGMRRKDRGRNVVLKKMALRCDEMVQFLTESLRQQRENLCKQGLNVATTRWCPQLSQRQAHHRFRSRVAFVVFGSLSPGWPRNQRYYFSGDALPNRICSRHAQYGSIERLH